MNQIKSRDYQAIPSMDGHSIDKVRNLTELSLKLPQKEIETQHIIHAGVYSRTIMIPKDTIITGVLIKIPTLLIISGHAIIHTSESPMEVKGYAVIPASRDRKQAFYAVSDTHLTMIFGTNAKTIPHAESEFTDEVEQLLSHKDRNIIIITGE